MYKIENLLDKENHIRFFYPFSRLLTSKNSREITIPKYVLNEIDGLLLFGNVANTEDYKRYKALLVEKLLPIQFLTNDTTPEEFKLTINFIVNCYKSLASIDVDYKNIFDNFMCNKFEGILRSARQNENQMQDPIYLSLLAVFYLSASLQLSKNSG